VELDTLDNETIEDTMSCGARHAPELCCGNQKNRTMNFTRDRERSNSNLGGDDEPSYCLTV
jgi:hypothetical protein